METGRYPSLLTVRFNCLPLFTVQSQGPFHSESTDSTESTELPGESTEMDLKTLHMTWNSKEAPKKSPPKHPPKPHQTKNPTLNLQNPKNLSPELGALLPLSFQTQRLN